MYLLIHNNRLYVIDWDLLDDGRACVYAKRMGRIRDGIWVVKEYDATLACTNTDLPYVAFGTRRTFGIDIDGKSMIYDPSTARDISKLRPVAEYPKEVDIIHRFKNGRYGALRIVSEFGGMVDGKWFNLEGISCSEFNISAFPTDDFIVAVTDRDAGEISIYEWGTGRKIRSWLDRDIGVLVTDHWGTWLFSHTIKIMDRNGNVKESIPYSSTNYGYVLFGALPEDRKARYGIISDEYTIWAVDVSTGETRVLYDVEEIFGSLFKLRVADALFLDDSRVFVLFNTELYGFEPPIVLEFEIPEFN